MSQNNKLSLWQKIKQMLSTSAPKTSAHEDDQSTTEPLQQSTDNAKTQESITKVSLQKTSHNDAFDTPITDSIKEYLHHQQWHYTYYRPIANDKPQSHHLSLSMYHKEIECGYLFRVQEDNALLAVYGILPFLIPKSHQTAAMLLMTQINYDMLIGNLEMDISDGEIRYKNAIDVDAIGIDDAIIEHLLQSVVVMTTVAYELFSDLMDTKEPSEDMPQLLDELRERADSRTFFLPTDFVQ